MSSPSNKEQFLKQFESIVKGIVDNKDIVMQPLFKILYSREKIGVLMQSKVLKSSLPI